MKIHLELFQQHQAFLLRRQLAEGVDGKTPVHGENKWINLIQNDFDCS
jgi:hypothetical protein